MRGIFIAFEGVDGSGITTHSRLVAEKLKKAGMKAVYTKEPTDSDIGKLIKSTIYKERVDSRLLALLFATDRLYHVLYGDGKNEGILKLLEKGFIVICDRYKYSSFAYQGVYQPEGWVHRINQFAPNADIIVYLDVPIEVVMRRIRERERKSVFEEKAFLKEVKKRFRYTLKRAEKEGARVVVVNELESNKGSIRSIEEVNSEIVEKITAIMNELESNKRDVEGDKNVKDDNDEILEKMIR
ncbi:MAG: dTMP kinase [Caldisphaeraceae archaeon]|nr:dTMP kinase [Caldisphaeraceae archaeon]